MPIGVNLSLKALRNLGFMPSLDPPRIPTPPRACFQTLNCIKL